MFFELTAMKILAVNDNVTYFLNDDGDYRAYIECTQEIFPIVLGPITNELTEFDCPFWTSMPFPANAGYGFLCSLT